MRYWAASLLTAALAAGVLAPAYADAPEEAPTPAPAGAESGDELAGFIAQIESTYQDVQSLGADFVQVTRSVAFGEEPPQKGKVWLQRPQKMRWEFSGSDAKLFVTDGNQMWIHAPADNQCHVYKDLGASGGGGLEDLLTNLDQLDELFSVEMLDDGRKSGRQAVTLMLTPHQEANFKHLRLVVARKKLTLEELTIIDPFDNETLLTFSGMKLNVEIPKERFVFVPPEGCEVVSPDGL